MEDLVVQAKAVTLAIARFRSVQAAPAVLTAVEAVSIAIKAEYLTTAGGAMPPLPAVRLRDPPPNHELLHHGRALEGQIGALQAANDPVPRRLILELRQTKALYKEATKVDYPLNLPDDAQAAQVCIHRAILQDVQIAHGSKVVVKTTSAILPVIIASFKPGTPATAVQAGAAAGQPAGSAPKGAAKAKNAAKAKDTAKAKGAAKAVHGADATDGSHEAVPAVPAVERPSAQALDALLLAARVVVDAVQWVEVE